MHAVASCLFCSAKSIVLNHTGRRILTCRNNRVQAERHLVYVGVVLDVVTQIEPELI